MDDGINRKQWAGKRDLRTLLWTLLQDSGWFFKGSKIHINPYTPKISMLILLNAFHTLHIFLSLTDSQNFPGPVAVFQDFPVLKNTRIKFQVFQDPYEPWYNVHNIPPHCAQCQKATVLFTVLITNNRLWAYVYVQLRFTKEQIIIICAST